MKLPEKLLLLTRRHFRAKKIHLLINWMFLLVFLPHASFAQLDSLLYQFRSKPKTSENVMSLLGLTHKIVDYNLDSALSCAHELLNIEIPESQYKLQCLPELTIGTLNKLKGNYDDANTHLTRALIIAEKGEITSAQIICLYQIGDLNRGIGLLDESLRMLYLSRNLALKTHENHMHPQIYDRMSATFFQLADHNDALFEFIEIPDQTDFGPGKKTAGDYIELCKVYADSANMFAKKINDTQTQLSALNLIGAYYRHKKQYEQSIQNFYKALSLSLELGFKTNVPNYYANIAKAWYDQGKYNQAIEDGLKGYEIANELKMESEKSILAHTLRLSYEKLGDFENALRFHIVETETREYIYSQENWNKISELDKKYQSEKQQQEIKYQKELIDLQNVEVFRLNIVIIIMFVVLIIILIGVILIRKQKQRIQTQSKMITEQFTRLEKLDQFKESLTHALVHDLKNPLSQVLINTRNQHVRNAAGKMMRLITNMLDVEKYENTGFILNKELHSLRNILAEVVNGQELSLKEKNLELHLHFTDFKIMADREVMIRVFDNLLSNAIRYSPLNRSIDVKAEPSGDDMLLICMENYGEHIPDDVLPLIFDKYRHFGKTDSGAQRSTGLGLTFCKMAIEAHGGTIGAHNNPDEGCSFCFTLKYSSQTLKKLEDTRTTIRDLKRKLNFTEADYAVLNAVVKQIQDFKIFEISRFHEVLDPLKETAGSNVNEWISSLFNAINIQNMDEYKRLINLAENEQTKNTDR